MKDGLRLDKNQIKAIRHGNGPLLIIAGAGTGKTKVITERIKYLIVDKNLAPQEILALTFTEKAAFEMQERVDVLLPYGYTNLWIQTFHSFCERILRNEAYNIGLDPNFKLISESESILFVKQNIFNLGLDIFRPLGNPNKFIEALLIHFSRLKDEDVSPKHYVAWAKKLKNNEEKKQYIELSNAYLTYEKLKVKNSFMDFSDLISNTLKLFRDRKNILQKYQKQFKFILVDEFQDTNFAQNELAILLSGDDKNITVVADDDQSIYRFRGAAVSNVLQFKKNYKETKIITLNQNYRSTQTILDAAYNLIQNNNPNRLEILENIDKKLKSNSSQKEEKIHLIHEERAEDESQAIADKIKDLTNKGFAYKDMAILVRANNHSQSITTALYRNKIPYQFLGPGYLFQQEEIKDLIAYLTFLTNLSDSVSLFRVLSMKIFEISPIELNYLLNFSKKLNISLFDALYEKDKPTLKQKSFEKIENFKKMVEKHLEKSRRQSAGQILYEFVIDSSLFDQLQDVNSVEEEKRIQNIAKFFDKIKNFESERSDANIYTLVDWLTLMLTMGDSPLAADIDFKDRNAVSILTVHSSKGLEFKVIFMVNLVNDRFPTRERKEKIPLPENLIKEKMLNDSDFHLEEERRLFYVGITRAKEILYFTSANFYAGGKRPKKLSPFIYEALPGIKPQEKSIIKTQQLSLNDVLAPYKENKMPIQERPKLKLDYITYSNIQMFDICPLHYKARAIFRIPTPPTGVQSFGISIHNSLYDFYKIAKETKTPSLNELKQILKKEWIREGYESKEHEKERYAQAIKILENFYKNEGPKFKNPLEIEIPFRFTLKNGVKVFGKIDRVDKKGDGIEIIDYKTGADNPKAKKAHELQLKIYALAATKVKDPVLNQKPENITLTLYFLEGNTKTSMNFKSKDLEDLENELIEEVKEIENSDFKCSKNLICRNCEFKMLCSYYT